MRTRLAGLAVVALLVGSVAAEAAACWPGRSVLRTVAPATGTHPANAPIVFEGAVLYDRHLAATIDGEPAELIVDRLRSAWNPPDQAYYRLALQLSPEPAPGQTVHVNGDACASWGGSCPVAVTYVAGPRETETPPAVDALWFDWSVSPSGDPWREPDSCGARDRVATLYAHARVPAGVRDGHVVRLWASPEVDGLWGAPAAFLVTARAEVEAWIGMDAYRVGYPVDISRACVHARLLGPTGAGPISTVCAPCAFDPDGLLSEQPRCFVEGPRECPSDLAPSESPLDFCVDAEPDGGVPDAAVHDADGGAPARSVTYGCAAAPASAATPFALVVLAAIGAVRRRARDALRPGRARRSGRRSCRRASAGPPTAR